MKRVLIVISALCFLCGCSSKELKREEALRIIKEELNYPHPTGTYLFCRDPAHARKAIKAGLEEKGFFTVQRKQKLKDAGQPIIHLTPKAKPFLLETTEKDKADHIQRLKTADVDIAEVTGIHTNREGTAATVEYTVTYKNVTDFAALSPNKDYTKPETKRAELALYDDGWRLERRK